MENKTYSIFGAGAAGLYTAWRLLKGEASNPRKQSKLLSKGDVLELYDWGKYDFSKKDRGTREPGARVCTWHYKDDKKASYLELGGMRYSEWSDIASEKYRHPDKGDVPGHRLVSTTIRKLHIDKYSVPFNESADPLLSLRARNMYVSEINSNTPAPYAVDHYGADAAPDDGFTTIEAVAITGKKRPKTRKQWCKFFQHGQINVEMADSAIFNKGDYLKDIGYWNLAYDRLGQEGFSYLADGNGYSSNVVNSNSAQSFEVNDEFTPGTQYKTLTKGFSFLFTALFNEVVKLARSKRVKFIYHPDTRLRSILEKRNVIHFTTAKRRSPDREAAAGTCDAAFLAMPRSAIELVAQATRFVKNEGTDVLNHEKVQLYLESVLMEPSYKIGMFFDYPWWREKGAASNEGDEKVPRNYAVYPARLTSYFVTDKVIFLLNKISPKTNFSDILYTSYESRAEFLAAVVNAQNGPLTFSQEEQLSDAAELDTIGPSVTDMPIRQVVYFGDNALEKKEKRVYGILASYDDINYTTFWKALELGPRGTRKTPESRDCQPLAGPRKATPVMVKMLRQQLAALHFGPQSQYSDVPMPLETRYMDWSLPPFNAGYHAYKSHYDIGDVQQKIRKPSQLIKGVDANIFIVGETYSNDQAWVEGAFCTAESVLKDFFGIKPIINDREYPLICSAS